VFVGVGGGGGGGTAAVAAAVACPLLPSPVFVFVCVPECCSSLQERNYNHDLNYCCLAPPLLHSANSLQAFPPCGRLSALASSCRSSRLLVLCAPGGGGFGGEVVVVGSCRANVRLPETYTRVCGEAGAFVSSWSVSWPSLGELSN
jgi:hypothetical protein